MFNIKLQSGFIIVNYKNILLLNKIELNKIQNNYKYGLVKANYNNSITIN